MTLMYWCMRSLPNSWHELAICLFYYFFEKRKNKFLAFLFLFSFLIAFLVSNNSNNNNNSSCSCFFYFFAFLLSFYNNNLALSHSCFALQNNNYNILFVLGVVPCLSIAFDFVYCLFLFGY